MRNKDRTAGKSGAGHLDAVRGAFARIEPDDIQLDDYQSHAAIPAPMAT